MLELLWGTVIHRPYVYVFFITYLFFSIKDLGLKKSCIYIIAIWCLAWCSEYSSTHGWFVPFGPYTYLTEMSRQELWIGGVPFWDSLSFVFLTYFSSRTSHQNLLKGALLMVLLDITIDPVTLQGHRWFLGRIYYYPEPGFHFGVTFFNYIGWFMLGLVSQKFLIWLRDRPPTRSQQQRSQTISFIDHSGPTLVYMGILTFNLAITLIYISDIWLQMHNILITAMIGIFLWTHRK